MDYTKKNEELLQKNMDSIIEGLVLLNKCVSCQRSITNQEISSYRKFIHDIDILLIEIEYEFYTKPVEEFDNLLTKMLKTEFANVLNQKKGE